jgi:hypothetical protein
MADIDASVRAQVTMRLGAVLWRFLGQHEKHIAEAAGVAPAGNLWVPKTCATCAYASSGRRRLGPVSGTWLADPGLRRTCDDLRLVGLKLVFLIVTRAVSLLGLSRRESWWKDAEILMLRHQLAVAEREHPGAHWRLTWPDRAWLALLAGTLPIALPDGGTDLDHFRAHRRDRAGGVIHEYRLVA